MPKKTKSGRSGKYKRPSRPSSHVTDLSESELEAKFYNLTIHLKPAQQHYFHPERRWRFDFAWPEHKLAVEIQGFGSGHNSYTGMSSDYEKHNEALRLGWRILYFMSHDLFPPNSIQTLSIVRINLGLEQLTDYIPSTSQSFNNSVEAARRRLNQIIDQKDT